MSVPPVFQPPPPPVVIPPPPAPQVLVRTGRDLGGPARLAGILLLVGMTLVIAARRFGDGGPGLTPVPAGPSGGPGGGHGGPWFGDDSWFAGPRLEPPSGPLGGLGGVGGLGGLGARMVEPPPLAAEPEAAGGEAAPAEAILGDVTGIDEGQADVLVPTSVLAPTSSGLDAAALDAANADGAAPRPRVPAPGGRRSRRLGGR